MYDGPVKRDLLKYAYAMLELSLKGVDPNIVGCNRSEKVKVYSSHPEL